MDFVQLRNQVEHVAAIASKGASVDEANRALGEAILLAGQILIGIYEELAGIRAALGEAR